MIKNRNVSQDVGLWYYELLEVSSKICHKVCEITHTCGCSPTLLYCISTIRFANQCETSSLVIAVFSFWFYAQALIALPTVLWLMIVELYYAIAHNVIRAQRHFD